MTAKKRAVFVNVRQKDKALLPNVKNLGFCTPIFEPFAKNIFRHAIKKHLRRGRCWFFASGGACRNRGMRECHSRMPLFDGGKMGNKKPADALHVTQRAGRFVFVLVLS